MNSNYRHIRVTAADAIATITLNRPEKLNAIDEIMHHEILDALVDIDADEETRVIVLTGEGRGFCAGGDVSQMPGAGDGTPRRSSKLYLKSRPLVEGLLWVEKPIIAKVNGVASGLGATLALFCDIVIASNEATFGDSHVNVGLVAGDGGAVLWPLLIGIARSKEYLLTGKRMSAHDAERLGLVNCVVDATDLDSAVGELASQLAAQPAFAVRATKASINRELRRSVHESMDVSGAWQLISLASDEHRDAVAAFAARRKSKS